MTMTPRERIAADLNIEVGLLVRELVPLVRAHRELTGEDPESFIKVILEEYAAEGGLPPTLATPTPPLSPGAGSAAPELPPAADDPEPAVEEPEDAAASDEEPEGDVPEEPDDVPRGGLLEHDGGAGDAEHEAVRELLVDQGPITKSALCKALWNAGLTPARHRLLDGILEDLGASTAGTYKGGTLYVLPPAEDGGDADPPSGPSSDTAPAPGEGPSEPANSQSAAPAPDEPTGQRCVECGGKLTFGVEISRGKSEVTKILGHLPGCVLDPRRAEPAEPPEAPAPEEPPEEERYPPDPPEVAARARAEGQTVAMDPPEVATPGDDVVEGDAPASAPAPRAPKPAPPAPPISPRVARELAREQGAAPADPDHVPFPPSGDAREDHRRQAMAKKVIDLLKTPMTIKGIASNLYRSRDDVTVIVQHLARVGWVRNSGQGAGGTYYELVPKEERP
jgi:hypothetical protein